MDSKSYDPSDSLISVCLHSLDISEPDLPESSSPLVFRDGEWQLPLDEDDMDYQSFKLKMASSQDKLYRATIENCTSARGWAHTQAQKQVDEHRAQESKSSSIPC